jgi:hypothetical protein
MVDGSRGIGSAGQGGSVTGLRDTFSREPRSAARGAPVAGNPFGATPNGPRGRRMLAPDTPLESLDRGAPRGSYLDLLV